MSSFKFVPHIAIQVSDAGKAVDFYRRVLGMELVAASPGDGEPRLRSNGMTFHVEESPRGAVFFGFEVENLDDAKRALQGDGCELQDETERGFMVKDPYGLRYYVSLPD